MFVCSKIVYFSSCILFCCILYRQNLLERERESDLNSVMVVVIVMLFLFVSSVVYFVCHFGD